MMRKVKSAQKLYTVSGEEGDTEEIKKNSGRYGMPKKGMQRK